MTRLVVLSDLHFGMHRAALVPDLVARINSAAAELVIIAGDLTHRGRAPQFDEAMAFISAIEAPWMAVPGNHDVPLFDILARLSRPYRLWRSKVGPDLLPIREGGAARVIGVNSVDPRAWQRGLFRARTRRAVLGAMAKGAPNICLLYTSPSPRD